MKTGEEKHTLLMPAACLLGSFVFAYNVAIAVHELGHVLGAWIDGRKIQALVIDPLGPSYVVMTSGPSPLLTILSGLAGPPIAAGAGILLAVLIPSALARVPLITLGAVGMGHTGVYLLVGLALRQGDAAALVSREIPAAAIASVGTVCVLLGISMGASALHAAGVMCRPLGKQVIVLALGLLPYPLALSIRNFAADSTQAFLWTSFSVCTLVVGAAALVLARSKKPTPGSRRGVGRDQVALALALGMAAFLANRMATPWVSRARDLDRGSLGQPVETAAQDRMDRVLGARISIQPTRDRGNELHVARLRCHASALQSQVSLLVSLPEAGDLGRQHEGDLVDAPHRLRRMAEPGRDDR